MVEPKWSIKCANSTLDLLDPSDDSYTDLKTQHRRRCWKYFCWCRRHTISVICINETRKLYWFNCRNVQEKVTYGSGEGYYHRLLRLVNGALNTWAQRYIDGLSVARREIMLKINGSADNNMRLLKEGCYCHYHPHMTADACNADFLRRVVSFWAGESLRGIRERLRGMTNITKKVEDTNRESSLFSCGGMFLLIYSDWYIVYCSRIYIYIYISLPISVWDDRTSRIPPSCEIPITWHALRAGARVEGEKGIKSAPSSVSVGLSFVDPLNYSHSLSHSE